MKELKAEIKFSYEDYKNLPESETKRYELLEGDLIMVLSPTTYHQQVSRNLEYVIWNFVQKNNLGYVYDAPLDVILSGENVVQPDIFFISKDRSEIITEENIKGDLICQIRS